MVLFWGVDGSCRVVVRYGHVFFRGGGLLTTGGAGSPKNDCVLYARTKQDPEWREWTGGLEVAHRRSVKQILVNALGRTAVQSGIL